MTAFLRQWLLALTAAALLVALAQALTPAGTVKRVLSLVGGVVLMLAAVRPFLALEGASLAALAPLPPAEDAGLRESGEEVLKVLIAEKTSAYIVDKGAALGCSLTARVTVAEDGSGWPVPWSASLSGRWTPEQKNTLSALLEQELDIPEERQTFQEEEP